MRRREFIELFGGALMAWPLPAQAQRGKIPRIGIIDDAPVWDNFRKAMSDLGYVDGQTIIYEYRTAEGNPARLLSAAKELASLPVDVIVEFGSTAARAAKMATGTVPIVMISIGDPVRAGFVAKSRPGRVAT